MFSIVFYFRALSSWTIDGSHDLSLFAVLPVCLFSCLSVVSYVRKTPVKTEWCTISKSKENINLIRVGGRILISLAVPEGVGGWAGRLKLCGRYGGNGRWL